MSVRGAAFIGIGSMVGAGIFALLGEAAGGGTTDAPGATGHHRHPTLQQPVPHRPIFAE